MEKKVLFVTGIYMDLEMSGNNRTNFVPKLLHNAGYSVEMITSNFSHHRKEYMNPESEERAYKLTVLKRKGYKKNVSLARLFTGFMYAQKVKRHLKKRNKPDVIYISGVASFLADVVRKYAIKNNIKLVVDVRDLWPEAFKMVFNVPIISSILYLPFKLRANRIYRDADELVAVSETYLQRALSVNSKVKNGHVIYLGTSLKEFDSHAKQATTIKRDPKEILLIYVGTLGNSYDLRTTFEAMSRLRNKGYDYVKLIVLGSGPMENGLKKYAKKLEINVDFYGRLPYKKMVPILVSCDIALNPIKPNAAQSIINKHADYAAAGIPVVNTQDFQDYRTMVENNNIGLNARNNDSKDMAEKIIYLVNKPKLRKTMGQNHRKLAEDKFDRDIIYRKLLDIV